MFAYDYPLLDVFMTISFFILLVIWLWLLLRVIADLFRDPEQSGWGKVMWLVIIFVLPYIGVIAYLAAHGGQMSLRYAEYERRGASLIHY
jgi:phospholipase D-like protein